MSNIFKFYINNTNQYNKLYLFIKNKYLETQLDLPPSIEELNANYSDSAVFLKSSIFEKYFNTIKDFNENDIIYLNNFNTKLIFVDNFITYSSY